MRIISNILKNPSEYGWETIVFRTSIILSLVSVLVLVALLSWHFDDKSDAIDSAQQEAIEGTKQASRQISPGS